jgi:U3 small nucleolar RNA-associated protein 22
LEESVEGLTTRVGLENEDTDVFNQGFLDVTYESGASFRLRIHHEREQSFLERQLRDKSVDPKTRELAAMALAKYKCDSLKSPAHTQAIAQLCNRFPAMSGTMRLTKKWFASHLLSNHIAEEVIELLVARTFVQPWPWTAPSSVQTGFLRTLFWISRWDWRADPLIVDLSGTGELKQSEMQAITTRFEAWRKLDPSLNRVAVFAASNVDQDGVSWTDGNPSKVAAGRLTALARAAIVALEQQKVDLEPASLFVSPVTDFDFVLHLSATATGRKRRASKAAPAFKNLELETLSLLSELDVLYGSAILFFANGTDKPVIAGLWNPQTAPRSWKVNLSYSTVPVKAGEEDQVSAEINKDAILSEIARLGGDLISKIEVNR